MTMTPQRVALLKALGIGPLWRLRSAEPAPSVASEVVDVPSTPLQSDSQRNLSACPATPRSIPSPVASPHEIPAGVAEQPHEQQLETLDWEALESQIRACATCRLCEQRKQAVPGVGDRQGDWMLIGEGPGAEEDRRGEPFVGPAGKLLDAMLAAIGLAREQGVYITNAVKCRPPLNRTPHSDEIETCRPFLERQIALVQPRILVAMGRPAAQALLRTEVRINAVRGKVMAYQGIPLIVTYHPAYLLRNPADKGKAWQDLCLALQTVNQTPSRA